MLPSTGGRRVRVPREQRVVDIVNRATRSRMMAAIGPTHTKPELAVRRYLHGAGLTFRLHARNLQGKPDIVLPAHRAVVFVHGCFWHRHDGCRFTTTPNTRHEFWQGKFLANTTRDRRQQQALKDAGWLVFVIWECQASNELVLDMLVWSILGLK